MTITISPCNETKDPNYAKYTKLISMILFNLYKPKDTIKLEDMQFHNFLGNNIIQFMLETLYYCRDANAYRTQFTLRHYLKMRRGITDEEKDHLIEIWSIMELIFKNENEKKVGELRGEIFEKFVMQIVYSKYEQYLNNSTIRCIPHCSVFVDGRKITKKRNLDYGYERKDNNNDFAIGEFGECKIKGTGEDDIEKLKILQIILETLESKGKPSFGLWITLSPRSFLENKLGNFAPDVILIGIDNFNIIETQYLFSTS